MSIKTQLDGRMKVRATAGQKKKWSKRWRRRFSAVYDSRGYEEQELVRRLRAAAA